MATTARKKNPWAFKPYTPPPIPTGSYDPALDAQLRAAGRGYDYTRQDTETANQRAADDYGIGQAQLNRQYDWTSQDAMQSLARGKQDISTGLGRADEDKQRALDVLGRSYGNLATRQEEGRAQQSGLWGGGAALEAAAKRQSNQNFEGEPIWTANRRAHENAATAGQRLNEDVFTTVGRAGMQKDLGLAQLALGYGRDVGTRNTGLTRAGQELGQFGLDIGEQKAFQAAQSGYVPPQRGEPGGIASNQFVGPTGQQYRVIVRGNERLTVDPTGKVLSRRRRR